MQLLCPTDTRRQLAYVVPEIRMVNSLAFTYLCAIKQRFDKLQPNTSIGARNDKDGLRIAVATNGMFGLSSYGEVYVGKDRRAMRAWWIWRLKCRPETTGRSGADVAAARQSLDCPAWKRTDGRSDDRIISQSRNRLLNDSQPQRCHRSIYDKCCTRVHRTKCLRHGQRF
jgi:hypothetical protein